jgi:hypothetical protein
MAIVYIAGEMARATSMSLRGACLRVTIAVIALSLARSVNAATYHDPFDRSVSPTEQSVVGRASAGPSLRVVLAGSTGSSMKDLADWGNLFRKLLNPTSSADTLDPQHFRDDLNILLAQRFRSIEYVYWNAQEGRSPADYILTLEIGVTIGKHTFGENRVDLQGVLSGPDLGQKETLAGHGKSKVGFPASDQHFAEARKAAFDEFSQNLSDSHLLAAYKEPIPSPVSRPLNQTKVSNTAAAVVDGTPAPKESLSIESEAGLYDVEPKIQFNVLDSAYYDAASGDLALIGHHDDRFKGSVIPYLQHLATFLDNPEPEFSLAWTPDSHRRVDAMLARELTQQESDAEAARVAHLFDGSGLITHTGTLMLPSLGIYPINDNRAPGDLGVEVESINGGRVAILKVKPGSAADKAGLMSPDFIISVRPDRPVFFASEFARQVRFAGAGAEIEIRYQHHNDVQTVKVTLDAAANPDPWYEVNRFDVIGIMYRAAGDRAAADVAESFGIMNRMTALKEEKSFPQAFQMLMHSLGMDADLEHIQQVTANAAAPFDDANNFGIKLSQRLDSTFHFAGNPVEKAFESAVRQTHEPGNAIGEAFNEFDKQFLPKFLEIFDTIIYRPGVGFLIPPELVEEEYHIHPEMTPQYLGVPPDSQLARLMLASDYLAKQLSNRQDLKRTIPGYQTKIEYQILHPETDRTDKSAYRVWISVADINAVQSREGRTLALRQARMRFNEKETDNEAQDLPSQQAGGYDDVLTGLYDQFELQFPVLHELREAAKLAAVAAWMRKQNPSVRLPAEGRTSWKGPEKVEGLVYIYLTVNLRHESKIIKMAEGGISYRLPVAILFPIDSSVVDLRTGPTTATIFVRPGSAVVRAPAGASPYVASWIASAASGEDAVVLDTRPSRPPDSPQTAATGVFGTHNSEPTLTKDDPSAEAVGIDTDPKHQLNTAAQNARLLATNAATIEGGSETARLGFDKSATNASAVDVPAVQTPSSASDDDIDIPDSMLTDKVLPGLVMQLDYYKQRALQSHKVAAAAQAKFEAEQKRAPDSHQLPVLLSLARVAQDIAGDQDKIVKYQTHQIKKRIADLKGGEDGDAKSPPAHHDSASPPPPPPSSPPPLPQ